MATREPPVELFYSPEDLDPDAPRLRVARNGNGWELRDDEGVLLSKHPSQSDAIDAALERSKLRFSEILVRGSTGRAEWVVGQDSGWEGLCSYGKRREGRWWDWKNLRVDTGLRLIMRSKRLVATREPPVKLYYDAQELDPDAPRLRIRKSAGLWELRDEQGTLLNSHSRLPDAIDAALDHSEVCFSEILVMAATGEFEWSVHHTPEFVELARAVNRPAASEREAAD